MAASIPLDKRTLLVKLLGMLGSDFDGERANAGRKADDLVRSLGLQWNDIVATAGTGTQQHAASPGYHKARTSHHRDVARACLSSGRLWTDWEPNFLTNVQDRWRLSERQEAVLGKLCRQAGVEAEF